VDEEAVTRDVGEAQGADPQTQTTESGGTPQTAGRQGTTVDDPRIPWSGRPRLVDILCWAGIVLSGIYYWALLPFVAPLVGTRPVLLEVLNGNTAAIISAAAFVRVGHGTLVVVLLATLPGLMKFDLLYWWAGRLWGERIIALLSGRRNRGGRYMGRVDRWGRKFTWPAMIIANFVPIPSAIIYVIAGWSGMRLVTFLILDAIGTLLWAGMLAGLGYELGHHAVVVAQSISHYGLWISIGLVVVILFFQVRSQRHMIRAAGQARPNAGGQVNTAAAGGQVSPAAAGGQVSTAAQASGGDEAGG
jgi:membrane protein DedA with SNARE-associated domain